MVGIIILLTVAVICLSIPSKAKWLPPVLIATGAILLGYVIITSIA